MIECKYCNTEKPEDEMKVRGGKPSKVCIKCDESNRADKDRLRKIVDGAKGGRGKRGGKPRKKVLPLRALHVQRRTSSSSRFIPAASA